MISVSFSPKAFLPKKTQKDIQNRLFEDWREEEDTTWAKSPLRRIGSKDAIARCELSYWKTTQDHRYGGQMWLRFLIALGDIPSDLVILVNEEVSKKVVAGESRQATHQPSDGARKSDRNRASPPGGVCHNTSAAKVAREEAKRQEKQMKAQESQYQQGKSNMSWSSWRDMCEQVEAAWTEATRLSELAGVEYTGRDGVRHHAAGDHSMVNVVLERYIRNHPDIQVEPQHPDAEMPWALLNSA
jgi:hypothetical protein